MILLAVLCFSSCEYDVIEEDPIVIPPTQEISFANDILPIFTSNCVACHNGSNNPDFRPDNAYNSLIDGDYINIDSPENSEIYQKLQSDPHSTRASSAQKQLILEWITRGAKND
ncbi:hypothetical protein DLK05_00715 [Ancylomarina longa]|uniref:Cytochrome c domain-containing protein n=2 Tax=Ancylomarina longa TaxID=2487017 RepID=A0A434AZ58_9BACT|nr:hypothetical protein DLK05_00715 [Ancylomarina longa]